MKSQSAVHMTFQKALWSHVKSARLYICLLFGGILAGSIVFNQLTNARPNVGGGAFLDTGNRGQLTLDSSAHLERSTILLAPSNGVIYFRISDTNGQAIADISETDLQFQGGRALSPVLAGFLDGTNAPSLPLQEKRAILGSLFALAANGSVGTRAKLPITNDLARSLYYAAVTALTIGYGDVSPDTDPDRPRTTLSRWMLYANAVFLGCCGVLLMSFLTAAAVEALKKSSATSPIWGSPDAIRRTLLEVQKLLTVEAVAARERFFNLHSSFQYDRRIPPERAPTWLFEAMQSPERLQAVIDEGQRDRLKDIAYFLESRASLDLHDWRLGLADREARIAEQLATALGDANLKDRALLIRGRVACFRGEVIDATLHFGAALRRGEETAAQALLWQGMTNRFVWRFDEAASCQRRALEVASGSRGFQTMVVGELALLLARTVPEESNAELSRLVTAISEDTDLVELRAMRFRCAIALVALQRFSDAVRSVEEAEKLNLKYSEPNWAGNLELIRAVIMVLQADGRGAVSWKEALLAAIQHTQRAMAHFYGIDFIYPIIASGRLLNFLFECQQAPQRLRNNAREENESIIIARFHNRDRFESLFRPIKRETLHRDLVDLLVAI